MKSSFFTVAQIALLSTLGVNNADSNPLVNQGLLMDGDEYLRREITGSGSGTLELIDSQTTRTVGVSTFDKTKMPAGQVMVLEAIRLAVAVVPSSDTASAAAQAYSTKYSECPAVLRGAHFIIRQGGTTIVEIAVERLLNLGIVDGRIGDDAYSLPAFRLIQPETELQIQIRFPDAGAAVAFDAAKKIFIELHLLGPKGQKVARA